MRTLIAVEQGLETAATRFGRGTLDGESEDVALRARQPRYFDPTPGRWISEDPIEFEAGDTNLSRYVGNGPTNGTDPSGLIDPDTGGRVRGPVATKRSLDDEAAAWQDLSARAASQQAARQATAQTGTLRVGVPNSPDECGGGYIVRLGAGYKIVDISITSIKLSGKDALPGMESAVQNLVYNQSKEQIEASIDKFVKGVNWIMSFVTKDRIDASQLKDALDGKNGFRFESVPPGCAADKSNGLLVHLDEPRKFTFVFDRLKIKAPDKDIIITVSGTITVVAKDIELIPLKKEDAAK